MWYYFFKKNKYHKLKSELKIKNNYLKFITEYIENNKEKMNIIIDR